MSWDTATPPGTEAKSNGDNRIRELKTDIQVALRANAADGTEAKFPGASAATPTYRYRGLKGTTGARPAAGNYGLYVNTTLNTVQRDNGSSWEDVGTLIPSGTKMMFLQAAVPTGWTLDATHDGRLIRVDGVAGATTGGSADPATAITLAHSHTVNGHTHTFTTASNGAHTHTVDGHTHDLGNHTHSTPNHQHLLDYDTNNRANADSVSTATAANAAVVSDDDDGDFMTTVSGSNLHVIRAHRNRTQNTGSGTSGVPSSNTSGSTGPATDSQGAHTHTGTSDSTGPGTDSQLSNVSLAYVDVVVGTKD